MHAPKTPINLMRGWPSPDLLPASLISAACQRILQDRDEYTPILEYGPDEGHQPLREALAQWLGKHYGVDTDANGICVTGGASQSVACILQRFTDPNHTRAVWVIAPCYYLACGIFEDSGFEGRLRASPEDEEGVDLDVLEAKIQAFEKEEEGKPQQKPFKRAGPDRKLYRHIIYTVPTCANPSGKTMSLRRREGLVKLARKYDALVICDDVYDFLQWPLEGAPTRERSPQMKLPRLRDIDQALGKAEGDPYGFGHAISNGSFSKMAGPGVRTGWVAASPAFVNGLSKTASTVSGGAPSQLCAAIMAEMLRNGQLENFVEDTLRPALQRRHRLVVDAIRQHLVPLGVEVRGESLPGSGVYGGYFIWLTAPSNIPAKLLADVALEEEKLVLGYGGMFEVRGNEASAPFDTQLRLCFAWESEKNLVDGIRRLGSLLKRIQDNRDHYVQMGNRAPDESFIEAHK